VIIALTACALSSERERANAAGMDDFIIKPSDAQALVRSILRHVKPAGSTRPGQNRALPEDRLLTTAPWPAIEGIDSCPLRAREWRTTSACSARCSSASWMSSPKSRAWKLCMTLPRSL
jgi:DNA-binding response OmpR family regulator